MERLQKHLVICGMALILVGLVYGHAHSFITKHRALLTIKDDYQAVFVDASQSIADNDVESYSLGDIDVLNSQSTRYRRAIGAHAHAINLGLLMAIIGFVFSVAMQGNRHASKIGYGLLAGGIIYPLGLALQALGLVIAGEAFALLGAALVLSCLFITLLSILRLSHFPAD